MINLSLNSYDPRTSELGDVVGKRFCHRSLNKAVIDESDVSVETLSLVGLCINQHQSIAH